MSYPRTAAALGVALGLLLSREVRAGEATQGLARAREQLDAVQYDRAMVSAHAALEKGDASFEETAALWWIVGQAAAVLNQPALAAEALGKALEVAPGLALGPGASPKLAGPVARARGELTPGGLGVELLTRHLRDTHVTSSVTVRADTFHLVDQVLLFVRRGDAFVPLGLARGDLWTLTWSCPKSPCAYYAEARDSHGNSLKRVGSPQAPLETSWTAPVVVSARREAALYRNPRAYWIGAGVLAVAGSVLAFEFVRNQNGLADVRARPSSHTLAQAQAYDRQRTRLYPWMLGTLGGAGALGLLGVAFWVL